MTQIHSGWRIERYQPAMAAEWNRFVAASRNATFLFNRSYMDYHSDRFDDCSWLAFKGGALRALLPADIACDDASGEKVLRSHGGLSYGGWILPGAHLDGGDLLDIFEAATDTWRSEGIARLDYKPLPPIYAARPSEEDIYALFRMGGRLSEVHLSATIDLRCPGVFNQQQRRHLAKASALPIAVEETGNIPEFMDMLTACLRERHDLVPVHTAAEMQLLTSRFPENIKFYVSRLDGIAHAGVCVYDSGIVAHAQYIATTPEGRRLNLLTPLFHWLITERYAERRYFDFGISDEDHGLYLNRGLNRQKTSYGATATAFLRYTLDL
ncbi:MAG: GNAT family N-acetyltransferase [Muribaculaceae bacterium]|nr:GNAT family N-acetyltransferase [Muribaculaceae bacterium]